MTVAEVDPLIESLYRYSDVIGVLLMGIIGGTIARQRGYDIVGFFFIALFSALGGGMIRDVLINRGTVAAMSEPEYLILAFAGALIARFVYFKGKTWEYTQVHGDAIVSGLWAATGTVKGVTYGLPVLPCIMMGVFTATGGSMIRDIVTGRVPEVFGDNQPTVIPAVACAVTVIIGHHFDFLAAAMIIGPLISIGLSLLGYWANWRVSARSDWAPINDTAAQIAVLARRAEGKGRAVGRRLEPSRLRSWRHRQMEKALQRRIEAEVGTGVSRQRAEANAEEFLDEFNAEFPSAPREEASASEGRQDFGVDLAGDSYDDYGRNAQRRERDYREMLDRILADDDAADQLIATLMKKYRDRDDSE
nr:trimeric intracellular cation channel family protein [Corynebacterium lactis]